MATPEGQGRLPRSNRRKSSTNRLRSAACGCRNRRLTRQTFTGQAGDEGRGTRSVARGDACYQGVTEKLSAKYSAECKASFTVSEAQCAKRRRSTD